MHGRGACIVGGHVWWGVCVEGGACMAGGVCGRGHACQGGVWQGGVHGRGACVAGGYAWHASPPTDTMRYGQ